MANTGNQVVLNLKKINLTTALPTGEVKPNVPGDPDYVPPGENPAACPIDTTLACPIVRAARKGAASVIYEFSLPQSVLANPAFTNMQVILTKTDGTVVGTQTFNTFAPNFFQSVFADLVEGVTYRVGVKYRNAANAVIGSCDALASATLDALVSWQPSSGSCQVQPTCANGWTLDPTGTQCEQVATMAPNQPTGNGGTPGTALAVANAAWNNGGARVFAPGYALTGDGTVEQYLIVPHLWVNGNQQWSGTTRNTVDSRMNHSAVWSSLDGTPSSEWIGFARQIAITTAKTYYIGLAADNTIRFAVNGVDIVKNDSGNINGGPNFNFWNVYPVVLNAGVNYVEMYGKNLGGPGGFGVEIYDATLAQLAAVTTEAELEPFILFSSRDVRNQAFDLGVTVGYNCNAGWVLDNADPNPANWTCKQITRTPATMANTGYVVYAKRIRLASGVPDGYEEDNLNGAGLGPYFPPVQDLTLCPI